MQVYYNYGGAVHVFLQHKIWPQGAKKVHSVTYNLQIKSEQCS